MQNHTNWEPLLNTDLFCSTTSLSAGQGGVLYLSQDPFRLAGQDGAFVSVLGERDLANGRCY